MYINWIPPGETPEQFPEEKPEMVFTRLLPSEGLGGCGRLQSLGSSISLHQN